MSRAAQIEPWATLEDVQRVVGCERTKATEIIRTQLGGFKPAGLRSWRCTWKALREYKKAQEQGAAWLSYQSSHDAPKAAPTGIATSAPRMVDDSSERSTSETTEARNPERQQLPPSGKSKHVQRMVSLIAKHGRKPSAKRSKHSQPSKPSTV